MTGLLRWKDFVAKITKDNNEYVATILNMSTIIELREKDRDSLVDAFGNWATNYLKECKEQNKIPKVVNVDDVVYLLDSQIEKFIVDRIEDNDMIVLEREDRTHITIPKSFIETDEQVEENYFVLFDNISMSFSLGSQKETNDRKDELLKTFIKNRKKTKGEMV